MRKIFFTLSCIVLAVSCLLQASPSLTIPRPLQIPKMLAAANQVTPAKFPEAHMALVDDIVHSIYQANGNYVTWDDMAYKILTPKGRDRMKTLSTYYSSAYGKSDFVILQLYKADGRVITLPLDKLVKEMSDPGQMSSNIYDPNQKIRTVNVPGVQVGDTIRYCVRREVFKSRCPNTYSDIFVLESNDPIINFDIMIDGPKELPLRKIAVRDPVKGTIKSWQKETEDGRIQYFWNIKNVPVMITEPRMPTPYTVSQRLMISTIPAWEDVSKWYWNLCQPHMKTTPEMKAKVQELTQGLTDQQDIINSIFKFVSQEIRYVGITMEDDAPGYEPHDVAITFNNRHGVCRDKAALLAAMMQLAGLKSFPVLIMAGEKIDQEVCQPFFNHAITAVLDKNGKYILMDSTDENTRELFPAYLADKSFLVARQEGETLQTSPFSPAKDNLMNINTVGHINAHGIMEATSVLRFNGINDNAYRGFFASSSTEDQKDFLYRAINAIAPGATINALSITPKNMLNTDVPLAINVTFTAKQQFTDNNQIAMLKPPYLSRVIGMHNLILKSTQLDTRKYPYVTNMAAGAKETVKLTVDPVWGMPKKLPLFTNLDDGIMTWKRSAQFHRGVLTVTTDTSVNQIRFSPQEYLKLKQHLKTIHDNNRKRFIFFKDKAATAQNAKGNNAEIISEKIAYNLTDATTWTQTRSATLKILSYKGKKENSELLIGYNPSYQKFHLDFAQVTTTSKDKTGKTITKTHQINRKDIKIMDQFWVASAPRYPAAKICVIPLPAVEVGSIITYQYTRTTSGMLFFNLRESFREVGSAIRHKSITVNTPAQLKLSTAVFQNGILANSFKTHQNNISESFVTENNRAIWTWTATDQPAVPEEPRQAPVMAFTPTVFCSAYPWSEYISTLTQALKSKAQAGPQVKKLVTAIKNETARLAPAEAAVKQLQKANEKLNLAVRLAPPFYTDFPLQYLTTAETTLTDAYGHAGDRAIAAYTLLKALGFNPEFIFVSGMDFPRELFQQLYSTPSPSLFHQLLVRVNHNGETYWFNDQDQYADIRTVSAEGRFAQTEQGQLFTISPKQTYRTVSHTTVNLQLDDQGNAILSYRSPVTGSNYGKQNKQFSQLTPEWRRRHHLSLVQAFSPRAVPSSPLTSDFSTYPGKLAFTCTIPHFATLDGDYLYFTLPVSNFRRLMFKISDQRETPLSRFSSQDVSTSFTIKLPPSFKKVAMTPVNYQWQDQNQATQFRVTVTQPSGDELLITYQTVLNPTIVTSDRFQAYGKLDDTISHDKINTILLTK